jgi:hypothetical protein
MWELYKPFPSRCKNQGAKKATFAGGCGMQSLIRLSSIYLLSFTLIKIIMRSHSFTIDHMGFYALGGAVLMTLISIFAALNA